MMMMRKVMRMKLMMMWMMVIVKMVMMNYEGLVSPDRHWEDDGGVVFSRDTVKGLQVSELQGMCYYKDLRVP